jgi:pyrrolidone-carboxylate peptidase
VKISGDAGLFVCNYTYYNSLRVAQTNKWHSLFVHVPPFAVIPADTQLRFAANLLDVLAATILAQIAGPSHLVQPSTLVTAVA